MAALAAQYLHTQRNELAVHGTFGSHVQRLYDRLGLDLDPAWEVSEYRFIGNSSVVNPRETSGATSDGPDTLVLNASFENRSETARPYPLLRVVLRDRWTEVVAARDFAPGDYLPVGTDAEALMLPRERVLIRLHMVDPGEDVVGYDLDTCLHGPVSGTRCTNDVLP